MPGFRRIDRQSSVYLVLVLSSPYTTGSVAVRPFSIESLLVGSVLLVSVLHCAAPLGAVLFYSDFLWFFIFLLLLILCGFIR